MRLITGEKDVSSLKELTDVKQAQKTVTRQAMTDSEYEKFCFYYFIIHIPPGVIGGLLKILWAETTLVCICKATLV